MTDDMTETRRMPSPEELPDFPEMPEVQEIPDGAFEDFGDFEAFGEYEAYEGEYEDALVCPMCGALIPEGNLYCEACGEEISFVPEFEPEVDDSIASVLSDVADEIAADKLADGNPDVQKGFVRREDRKGDPYIDFHIRISRRALKIAAVVACAAALIIVAVVSVPKILSLQVFDNQSHASGTTAPQGIQTEETVVPEQVQPAPQVEAEDTPTVGELPPAPTFSVDSGRYEGNVQVEIPEAFGDKALRYFYTLDGTAPDINSIRYLSPILLEEGEYTIRAVAVDENDRASVETVGVYTVVPAGPAAPVILEESGEYTQSTMIVAVMQEGFVITYTTDGSEPQPDSTEYTAPIKMPVGSSVFRFRAFDSEGNGSEITDRTYHLAYARLVSEEQAVSSVVRVLMDKNVLTDANGKVLGKNGNNVYVVDSVIEIEGAGEYYRIVEHYQEDGATEETGLLYAVNTNDGTVHRLGYDSSGKYTLYTLSGR